MDRQATTERGRAATTEAIPPRPLRTDPAVLDVAAERLWRHVRPWLVENAVAAEAFAMRRQDVRDNIGSSNGYRFAVALEGRGWEPDDKLVAILARAVGFRVNAHDEAMVAWVREHKVVLPYAIGTRVRFVWTGGKKVEGPIDVRYERDASYSVAVPGEHGKHVYAEDVVPVDETVGQ